MKVVLLPLAIASAASQDIETSALLQTTKQQKALEERANSGGGLSGLERSVAGKKGVEHNVCDEDEAKKLIECFKFHGLSLAKVLEGEDVSDEVMEVAGVFADTANSNSKDTEDNREKSCKALHNDMKCMQSNACWKKNLVDVPHKLINESCSDANKDTEFYPNVKASVMCQQTPLRMCELITQEEHINAYRNGCNKKLDIEVNCTANMEKFVESTAAVETCQNGTSVVTTEAQCEKAANLLGRRFHILQKRFNRRPAGCYTHRFKKNKDTVYWNKRNVSAKRSWRFRGKNRPAICLSA